MRDDLGTRVRRGLAGAAIGSVIAAGITAVLKNTGHFDLELPVAVAIIVASLAYWAWRRPPT